MWLGIPENESFVMNSLEANNVIVLDHVVSFDSDTCKYLICCFASSTSCVSVYSLFSRAVCFLPECFSGVFTDLGFFCEADVSKLLVF